MGLVRSALHAQMTLFRGDGVRGDGPPTVCARFADAVPPTACSEAAMVLEPALPTSGSQLATLRSLWKKLGFCSRLASAARDARRV